jgi:hypothetical protein
MQGNPTWDAIEPENYLMPLLHKQIGLVDNGLTKLWNFTDEFIECLTPNEMKLRNDRLHTAVAHDGVSRAIDEWHEREGVLIELACNERDSLLNKEMQQAGLTSEEERELQELSSDIQLMEDDIALLRDNLVESSIKLTLATKAEKKERSKRNRGDLDARNHIENRILDLLFGISGAAYHGGKLNGVHSRKFMKEADKIFEAIEAYLLSFEGRQASDDDIKRLCGALRRLFNLLDGVFSKLRTVNGKFQDGDFDFMKESLIEVDKLWKELDLSQTPKYHALIVHAIFQAMRTNGFGDMLEDELEKSHQEALRFRARVARLQSMNARANAFSASEKVRNNPKVQQAISDAHEKTARKRKAGGLSLQETRKQATKTARDEKRVDNLVEEKDAIKGEPIKPFEHLKEEFMNEEGSSQE